MTKLRRVSLEYIRNAFIFLILCGISSFATMMIFRDISAVYTQLLLCIPFFIVFEVKNRSRNFFAFFGINLSLLALSVLMSLYLIDNLAFKIFIIAYAFAVIGISVYTRLSTSSDEISIMFLITGVVVNAVLSLFAGYFNVSQIDPIFIGCSLLLFILYVVYTRISRMDFSLEIIESTSVQPIHKIISFNNLITAIYLIFISIIILACVFLHAENLIIYAGRGLLRFIRFLASLTNSDSEPLEEFEPVTLPESSGGFDLSMLGEPGEPFFLFVILEKIFFFAMYALLILGVIFGICYLFYRIYRNFNDKLPENGDIKEFLVPDVFTERTGGVFNNMKEFFSGLFVADDNNKKIRRIFYKKVSGHISTGIDITAGDTAHDISRKIKEKEDVSFLADMYRRARYSNELMTERDVSACKEERK